MFDPEADSSFNADQRGQMSGPRNYVKFYRQWVRNNFKSAQEGREIGEEQDFIIIISPGQAKTEVRRKATDTDKFQYAQEWAAYLQGKAHQVSGTPIELLPGLPNGMADALKAMYIHTIEQMAELSDIAMQQVGMGGLDIRNRAKKYLQGSGETDRLRVELEQAKLTITTLETSNAALLARVNELEAAKEKIKPRAKRAPKAKSEPAVMQ